jgi:colanic acid/amylovoran biosynthesis protein
MKVETMNTQESSLPVVTVGLLWHSMSSDNLGVGALTESQLHICREAAAAAGVKVRFVIFGTGGGQHYGVDDADIQVGSRISIKQMLLGRSAYLKELDACDVVLDIGEGDSFTDIYGMHRFTFMIVSKLAVLAKRKPLILSPQTIGPFDRWYARKLAVMVMRRCSKVFARDQLSSAYLREQGVVENADEAIDVAFKLPFKKVDRPSDKLLVGLNVSGLLFSGGYSGTNQFGLSLDYAALVRDLLKQWAGNPAYEVWLISHVVPDHLPRDDDRVAIRQLAAEFPGVKCAPDFASPSEAKSFIAAMDFVTGARMHACIAAFSSGVPVVPMAYSRKFNGLFSSLGYNWVVDGKKMSNAEALAKTLEALANLDQLAAEIAKGRQVAEARLRGYTAFVANTLQSCVQPSALQATTSAGVIN